ncbi:hypothetical protein NDU88_005608 [Pleurodeles waltl]|uniref:Uncharacterized protein n=1 Tax=Pleurodeles waltl TaxID=8319 RepID=A0AAV7WZ19_PLEWA|nr:hypothetical protein NDU88_005606 [Pleurodeles waltl]KAJ1218022.1 hypothetical protein NDU88_005608 [Pleurodeles waltl]
MEKDPQLGEGSRFWEEWVSASNTLLHMLEEGRRDPREQSVGPGTGQQQQAAEPGEPEAGGRGTEAAVSASDTAGHCPLEARTPDPLKS